MKYPFLPVIPCEGSCDRWEVPVVRCSAVCQGRFVEVLVQGAAFVGKSSFTGAVCDAHVVLCISNGCYGELASISVTVVLKGLPEDLYIDHVYVTPPSYSKETRWLHSQRRFPYPCANLCHVTGGSFV